MLKTRVTDKKSEQEIKHLQLMSISCPVSGDSCLVVISTPRQITYLRFCKLYDTE